MPFTKITDDDRAGKGTVGMADTPNLTAAEMQVKFDELANLTITKFNNHVDEEGANTAAANTGAVDPTTDGTATNIQGVLDNLNNKKQEKVTGKGLSANDFTDTYKSNLETAFTNNHTHANKSVLDGITSLVKDAYDRVVSIFTGIASVTTTVNGSDTAVPTAGAISRYVQQMGGGDMVKSIYDTDNDGKVDHAEVADSLQNPIAATAVTYDHTASGMTAVNAQAAIDEVHGEAKNSVQKSAIENDLVGTDAENVLAAPQGKALDDKITETNSNIGILSGKIGDISGVISVTYDNIGKLLQYYVDNGYLPDVNMIPLIPTLTATNSNILANGDNVSYPAWYSYDNSDSTKFITNNAGDYIGYTFLNPVVVKKITWKGADSGYKGFSNSAKLQASSDNITWVDIQNVLGGATYNVLETRTIAGTTKYKYWRVIDSAARYGLASLQFYGN